MSDPRNQNLRIIFIGTPEFGAIVLKKMIEGGYTPIAVITAPDKPVGRRQIFTLSPVKILAEKNKIRIFQPENIIDLKSEILDLRPDLIILAAYSQIIPKEILEIPKYGSLNIHPSLLPKYRGPSPIQSAILNGDKKTGVTIILMDEKIDHGPVIASSEFQIVNPKITYEELNKSLAELGGELLVRIIPKWIKGEIKPKIQDDSKATFTKIIKKEDGKIDWQKPAEEIERKIRAYLKWPGSYTYLKLSKDLRPKIFKIYKANLLKIGEQKKPGEVFLTEKKELAVACGVDALILEEVQLEGKKKMSAKDFLNGYPQIVGSILFSLSEE